jgi:hypothetical protein
MDYTISDKLTQMMELISLSMTDAEKFENGNNAAGTRVRKNMQEIKKLAQSIRAQVSDIKNGEGEE